jgi:hypothetical protein
MPQEARDDSLGHAPNNGVLELVSWDKSTPAGEIQPHWMVGVGVEEVVDRDPAGSRYFQVGGQCWPGRDQKHVGPYSNRREDWGSRDHVVEGARQMLRVKRHPDFFPGFPNCRDEKALIRELPAATGQRHVAAPWISSPLGPPDQEDTVRLGADNDRDRGPEEGCVIVGSGLITGQTLAEANEPGGQCECDWQPPPQQPPLGGGPSRL